MAGELSAQAIVNKANLASYYAGADGRTFVRMRIVDAAGRSQLRQLVLLRRDVEEAGDQHFLVVFSRPADVRGTVYLVNKHPDADDDRWLYLPGLDLVKRISAGDNRTSFVGSHVYYEDVSGRSLVADEHQLVAETADSYQLRSEPKDSASVEFAYYKTHIDKQTFLPMLLDYYNDKDELIRSVEALKVIDVKGYPTVTEAKVTDHRLGGYTEMQLRFIDYDLGLPESLFSERSLRSPPLNWLKRSK